MVGMMNTSHAVRVGLKDLQWQALRVRLQCLHPPARTRAGHAFETVFALIKGTASSRGLNIAFRGTDTPLFRQILRQRTVIELELALIGPGQAVAGWCDDFLGHVNQRPGSHFRASLIDGPEVRSLAGLRRPVVGDEWQLDFLSPMPFDAPERTRLSPDMLMRSIHRRLEALFAVKLGEVPDHRGLQLLTAYWHYAELRHFSRSQNRGQARPVIDRAGPQNGAHWQYVNGCTGPLYIRGDLSGCMDWLLLAEALHAAGPVGLNGLGHFRLNDMPSPWLDRQLPAEIVQAGDSEASVADKCAEVLVGPMKNLLSPRLRGFRHQLAGHEAATKLHDLRSKGYEVVHRVTMTGLLKSADPIRLLGAVDAVLPRADKTVRSALARLCRAPEIASGSGQSRLAEALALLYLHRFESGIVQADLQFVRDGQAVNVLAPTPGFGKAGGDANVGLILKAVGYGECFD